MQLLQAHRGRLHYIAADGQPALTPPLVGPTARHSATPFSGAEAEYPADSLYFHTEQSPSQSHWLTAGSPLDTPRQQQFLRNKLPCAAALPVQKPQPCCSSHYGYLLQSFNGMLPSAAASPVQ